MAHWTMADALRLALKLEIEDFEQYAKGARNADNPGLKAMFAFLAGEEHRHMMMIRERMSALGIPEEGA